MHSYLIRNKLIDNFIARITIDSPEVGERVMEIPISPDWNVSELWEHIHREIGRRLDDNTDET